MGEGRGKKKKIKSPKLITPSEPPLCWTVPPLHHSAEPGGAIVVGSALGLIVLAPSRNKYKTKNFHTNCLPRALVALQFCVCMCVSGCANSTQMRRGEAGRSGLRRSEGNGGKAAVRPGGITPLAGAVCGEKKQKAPRSPVPPIRAGGEAGDLPSHCSEWLV